MSLTQIKLIIKFDINLSISDNFFYVICIISFIKYLILNTNNYIK